MYGQKYLDIRISHPYVTPNCLHKVGSPQLYRMSNITVSLHWNQEARTCSSTTMHKASSMKTCISKVRVEELEPEPPHQYPS